MINKLNFLFISLFGIGKINPIPGTLGSLFTIILLFFLFRIFNIPHNFILFFLIIVFICALFTVHLYIQKNKNKDPKEIVIDEFIGQSIPIYLYETAHGIIKETSDAIIFYFIIFILFRFFDIVKPFPVSYFDKNFKNSFGVIFDDIVAGFYVVILLVLFMIGKSYL